MKYECGKPEWAENEDCPIETGELEDCEGCYSDFRGNCRVPCTGDFWEKPCEKEDYENCDECVCNHCEFCPCEEETEEKT